MKKLLFIATLITSFSLFAEDITIPDFLSHEQRLSFYEQMISEIERLDAEIIETRNHAKEVKWDQFKQHYQNKVVNANNWEEFRLAFKHFSQGLVNLHTKSKFLVYDRKSKNKLWLNDDILFEYPASKFYLQSTKAEITHLNNTPITDALADFSNYRCRHNNPAGCIDMFSLYLKAGAIQVNGDNISSYRITDKNGNSSEHQLVYDANPSSQPDPLAEKYCETHIGYQGFSLYFSGANACLFNKEDTAIVRLRHFIYPDHKTPDFFCNDPKTNTAMCSDIKGLLTALHKVKPKHLIFDMTHNFGGNENSAILKAFMPNNFMDLAVIYRNTQEIHDKDTRNGLFWGNPIAEDWYQSVKDYQGDYFPIRGDFCRGKNGCHLSMIEPRANAYKAEKISIMTDWMCVSSCDDFVWRMHQFANAKLYGISPAQDATYARARILLYLDKYGEIKTKASGEIHSFYLDNVDYKIAEIILPYSKTVTLDGKLRNIQGLPVQKVPYTLDNQENYPQAVLDTILN